MDENRSNVEAVAIRGDRIQVIGAGIDHAWKLADTAVLSHDILKIQTLRSYRRKRL
ncbi:hypothetical protein MJD09_18965 [bacterium]|nr:hypothetical protein [bacterium]